MKNTLRKSLVLRAIIWVSLLLNPGCLAKFPVRDGEILRYSRSAEYKTETASGAEPGLQIRWLGTACHLIQLGDVAVLTDPFLTYHGLLRVLFGTLRSNPQVVDQWTRDLPEPRAIFVGHSHYDHLLDLAEVRRQRDWLHVPIYGSFTTENILAGYHDDIETQCRRPILDGDWTSVGDERFAYQAYPAEHAPQLPGVLLFPGRTCKPLLSPPMRASHFKVGETNAFLFRLRQGDTVFTVYFTGAATTPPMGLPPNDVGPVDVAILCVPGWKNVRDYPDGIIQRLKPRHVILSHFDNFLQEGRGSKAVVPTADLPRFLRRLRAACNYPGFEGIYVPDVGAVIHIAKDSPPLAPSSGQS